MPSKKKKYNARFPPARIKKIMQTDEDVGKVAAAVPVIISRALELFIESLIQKSAENTKSRNAKTLSATHIKQIITSEKKFDFLKDLVANIPDVQNADEELGDMHEEVAVPTVLTSPAVVKPTSQKVPLLPGETPRKRGRPRKIREPGEEDKGKTQKKRRKQKQTRVEADEDSEKTESDQDGMDIEQSHQAVSSADSINLNAAGSSSQHALQLIPGSVSLSVSPQQSSTAQSISTDLTSPPPSTLHCIPGGSLAMPVYDNSYISAPSAAQNMQSPNQLNSAFTGANKSFGSSPISNASSSTAESSTVINSDYISKNNINDPGAMKSKLQEVNLPPQVQQKSFLPSAIHVNDIKMQPLSSPQSQVKKNDNLSIKSSNIPQMNISSFHNNANDIKNVLTNEEIKVNDKLILQHHAADLTLYNKSIGHTVISVDSFPVKKEETKDIVDDKSNEINRDYEWSRNLKVETGTDLLNNPSKTWSPTKAGVLDLSMRKKNDTYSTAKQSNICTESRSNSQSFINNVNTLIKEKVMQKDLLPPNSSISNNNDDRMNSSTRDNTKSNEVTRKLPSSTLTGMMPFPPSMMPMPYPVVPGFSPYGPMMPPFSGPNQFGLGPRLATPGMIAPFDPRMAAAAAMNPGYFVPFPPAPDTRGLFPVTTHGTVPNSPHKTTSTNTTNKDSSLS